MADTRPFTVIEKVAEQLKEDLQDPNPERDTEEWIQLEPVNFDLSKYPRIHVHSLDSQMEGLSVGSTERLSRFRFQISIFIGSSVKLDVDNDSKLESAVNVKNYLQDRIIQIVNDNQNVWRNTGDNIYSVLTVTSQTVDTRNNVVQQNLECEILHRT